MSVKKADFIVPFARHFLFFSYPSFCYLRHLIKQNAPFHRVICIISSCEMGQITRPFASNHFAF
ncbi:hypothetical protein HMPREF9420_1457 [Segatella salivae DSM 15606]|uniref:Uncharacterized protein n=1 Tax=Segatella salivae DSM 15606 TaxID=888832 RepID=E6MPN9_9BACT|nr:hypothetical protein HMPREF9420_1457 [Segatella salivae DSM 15606]